MPQYLTSDDVQNYGSDLVDFAQRAAANALAPAVQVLEQQNNNLQRQIARETRARLDAALEAAIPNFREIDASPEWLRWLGQKDSLSGRTRQDLLNEACSAGAANRVIGFFRAFLQEQAASPAARAHHRGSGDSRSSAPPAGKIYTRAEIARLYAQHLRGAYRGREATWAEQEADIIAAGREGRISGGVDVFGK